MNGLRHREGDLPAVEYFNGNKQWWVNGKRHRANDLPAIEYNEVRIWWVNGLRHREGGRPAVVGGGRNEWWVNGKQHRDGGLPAFVGVGINEGYNEWWVNGYKHREGGLPAIELENGEKEWWLNGINLSCEENNSYILLCQRMHEKRLVKAQKKIFFWWIPICYDLEHKSGCGKRMAQKNLEAFKTMMSV